MKKIVTLLFISISYLPLANAKPEITGAYKLFTRGTQAREQYEKLQQDPMAKMSIFMIQGKPVTSWSINAHDFYLSCFDGGGFQGVQCEATLYIIKN